jgi:hypothetical protein
MTLFALSWPVAELSSVAIAAAGLVTSIIAWQLLAIARDRGRDDSHTRVPRGSDDS